MRDSDWWLPLSSYREMCRAHIARLVIEHRMTITFRGARRIYRHARSGMIYVKPGSLVPAHL